MKKKSSTKIIDGKKFNWLCRWKDQRAADMVASDLRTNYSHVRVLPEMVHGIQYYGVWKGPIRQHRKRRIK